MGPLGPIWASPNKSPALLNTLPEQQRTYVEVFGHVAATSSSSTGLEEKLKNLSTHVHETQQGKMAARDH